MTPGDFEALVLLCVAALAVAIFLLIFFLKR